VAESECGAYSRQGLYRYTEERFLARLTGVRETGRRRLESPVIDLAYNGAPYALPGTQWQTPYTSGTGQVLAACEDGPLALEIPVDDGRVVMLGSQPVSLMPKGGIPCCDDNGSVLATVPLNEWGVGLVRGGAA